MNLFHDSAKYAIFRLACVRLAESAASVREHGVPKKLPLKYIAETLGLTESEYRYQYGRAKRRHNQVYNNHFHTSRIIQ
jgi:hypothetical protein